MISKLEAQQKKEQKEDDNAQKTWIKSIVDKAKDMFEEGSNDIARMI